MFTRFYRRLTTGVLVGFLLLLALSIALAEATPQSYNSSTPAYLSQGHLYGESALIMDANSGDVLFDKNSRVRMYPASTTKIMTILLAVESGISFDEMVIIPQEAANVASDGSLVPVFPGYSMTFGDLVYGTMVRSGNDGCNAIAVLVSGSIQRFVDEMNKRAAEIGCTGTHFANPHGYHDDNHYSTAQDLALIMREALQYPVIQDIISTYEYTMHVDQVGEVKLTSRTYILFPTSSYYYEDCIGGKTGNHSRAGKCFVGVAEKDGATIITVTLKCETDEAKWLDTIRLFNYGFTRYTSYTLEQMFRHAAPRIATVQISNAKRDDPNGGILDLAITQVSDPRYERMVESNSVSALEQAIEDFIDRSRIIIVDNLVAPIYAGEILGSFTYTTQDGQQVTAQMIASRDVEAQLDQTTIYDVFPFLSAFDNVLVRLLVIALTLLILTIIIYSSVKKHQQARRRREIYEQRRREEMRRRRAQERSRHDAHSSVPQNRSRTGNTASRKRADDDDLFGDF